VVEVRTGPAAEHYDFAGYNGDQPKGEGPERGATGLRVSGRERAVHLSRVHAEFVLYPVPYGLHIERVRVPYVLFQISR